MWNLSFEPPQRVDATVLAALPDALRLRRASEWAAANKPGQTVDSFLEGPAFDRAGNLYLTDIVHGRIFRLAPHGQWHTVAETGGWPNGIAIDRTGDLWVADYRRGLLRVSPHSGDVEVVLGHRNSESFKGLNDLHFDGQGNLYFTDQGQTGLHDASGRVYRLRASGQLDLLLSNGPSPNGIALDPSGHVLYVAMTRANAVWRAPVLADGSLSKVGAFRTFFGTSGPDGLAVDQDGRLVVAHASLGGAFVLNPRGEVTHFVRSPAGGTVTNVAFRPGTSTLVMTESQTGTVLTATLPAAGAPLWSHA
ncbi:SMP-30/gluconolactonase/LRE family protein [Bordetella genomosp. 7]|uniref:Gluconolactonase n=1 Tax=Bordetella genomosp. 7 TaxID=1416805 RepID=A0A261QV18_9BORD|nr:SMP-30/gluconolactonase/LRE family protein [Bordetella genomosp. 7]OZI16586.1 gluconolactonase [Bordetella genomosp. 7]